MKLAELFESLKKENLILEQANMPDLEISMLTENTKKIELGAVFIAIKGNQSDGHQFIQKAIEGGAFALVVEDKDQVPKDCVLPVVWVRDSRAAMDILASHFYQHPSENIFTFGVTGTNGKTSITYLLEWVLKKKGIPCGVLGTIDHHLEGQVWPTEMTTPDSISLQKRLSEMKRAGARAFAMEVSSHALSQFRADSVQFDTAIFTNLTRDHLDYHKNMLSYFQSKQRLFDDLLWSTKKVYPTAVVNIDDDWGKKLKIAGRAEVWTYGQSPQADFQFEIRDVDFTATEFQLRTPWKNYTAQIPICGTHNVANAVAVIVAAYTAQVSIEESITALKSFPGVPGRLQSVPNHKGLSIFVDYAHTPDALENVLRSLVSVRKQKQNGDQIRIWTIFGCGGDRDKGKRPLMAKVAEENSDFVMVTSDNPRTEDPEKIIQDIFSGFSGADKQKMNSEVNRKKAIVQVLNQARSGDVVLIAGKGHEDYQIIGTEKQSLSDFQIAQEFFR